MHLRGRSIDHANWSELTRGQIEICGESLITYLDLSYYKRLKDTLLSNWIPPTVRALRSSPNMSRLPEEEEKQYQNFDSVTSLTADMCVCQSVLIPGHERYRL